MMLHILPFRLEVLSVPFDHVDQHDPNNNNSNSIIIIAISIIANIIIANIIIYLHSLQEIQLIQRLPYVRHNLFYQVLQSFLSFLRLPFLQWVP